MRNNNSDLIITPENGKKSKAQKMMHFERKLRDIYSDKKLFPLPTSNMFKKSAIQRVG